MILPNAVQAIQALQAAMQKGGVPSMTLGIVHLHLGASQINGCSPCVDPGTRYAKKAGEFDGVIFAAAARRDATYFTDAESAALALTEAVTRLSDRADPVPSEVWDEAARHYDEPTCGLDPVNYHDQRLQPPQLLDYAGGGLVDAVKVKRHGRGASDKNEKF